MPFRTTLVLMALAIGGALPSVAAAQPAATVNAAGPISENTLQVSKWIVASGDNRGLPFVVIDKATAAIFVFGADGQYFGTTPALLGAAHGDGTVVGIGDRALSAIRPDQRTTPAGRFMATFGPAKGYSRVLWVDYGSSLAMHPVPRGTKKERRQERLDSPSFTDNRITYGCINIAASFFEEVLRPRFGDANGIVYILPEARALSDVFPTFRTTEQQLAGFPQ